jgi:hypothetical protein
MFITSKAESQQIPHDARQVAQVFQKGSSSGVIGPMLSSEKHTQKWYFVVSVNESKG